MSDNLANFRELPGVGPATESDLHAAGVRSWASLVAVLDALANVRGVASDALRSMRRDARDMASDDHAVAGAGPGADPDDGVDTDIERDDAAADGATGDAAEQAEHGGQKPPAPIHRVVLDAGKVVGGRSREIDLSLVTAEVDRTNAFTFEARLAGRRYGDPEARWVTLGHRSGHGRPPTAVALHFGDLELAPGVHRLQLDVTVTLPEPMRTAPTITVD